MRNLINRTKVFLADEQGVETIEWILVAAALAVTIAIVYNIFATGRLQAAIDTIMAHVN